MKRTQLRRRAALRELHSLGATNREARELLGITKGVIAYDCRGLGIRFRNDTAGWMPARLKGERRAQDMLALYRNGETLQQIGDRYDLTRERVRQLLRKYTDSIPREGGTTIRAWLRRVARMNKKDEWAQREKGCPSYADYARLRDMRSPTRAFASQRQNASSRNIPWNLTLWEWWQIWEASGHWQERGRTRDAYVMCRFADAGAYEIGNVYIATAGTNVKHYYAITRPLRQAQQEAA